MVKELFHGCFLQYSAAHNGQNHADSKLTYIERGAQEPCKEITGKKPSVSAYPKTIQVPPSTMPITSAAEAACFFRTVFAAEKSANRPIM